MNNTTYSPKKAEIESKWYIIDAGKRCNFNRKQNGSKNL